MHVFVVWTNAYGTDDQTLALDGVKIMKDPRVKHYWDLKSEVAVEFGKGVKLPRDSPLAYDVYFVYSPGVEYQDRAPKPLDYMHQILEDERFFEASKFVKILEKQLSQLAPKT